MPVAREQIAISLAAAERAKRAHAAVRRRVRASANRAEGRAVAATILRHPPPHTDNLRVWHVLGAIPRVGPREAERILDSEDCTTATSSGS
jgi:hypothetical protein